MNGAERIKDRIIADARELCDRILEDAKREAQNIIGNAEKEAFQKVTVMTEKAREDALQIKQRLQAVSELEDRKMALKARQDSVDEAFDTALTRITALPDAQYSLFLEDILLKAVREGDGFLVLNEKDKVRLGEKFVSTINTKLNEKNAKLALAKDTLKSAGGFVLRYGDMEINCTIEILMNMARPALESEVAAILFG